MTTSRHTEVGLLLLMLAFLPAPAAFGVEPPTGDGKPADDNDRVLRVGDPVAVTISDLEGPGKNVLVEANVSEDGQVTLPMLPKPVPAAGLTADKLRESIALAYRRANLVQNAKVAVKLRPGKENEARPLRKGDALVVTIYDLEGPGKATLVKADVDARGEITLPILSKPVPADGLTREKLIGEIVKAYRRDNLIANATVAVKFRAAEKKEPAAAKE